MRVNIIGESKKVNVKVNVIVKKITNLFNNDFFKKLLLNTPFNNGFRHRIVIKSSV
jgi:hypothetical protein